MGAAKECLVRKKQYEMVVKEERYKYQLKSHGQVLKGYTKNEDFYIILIQIYCD